MFKYLTIVLFIFAWTYEEDVVDGYHWSAEDKYLFNMDQSVNYPMHMTLAHHEFPFGMTPAENFHEMNTMMTPTETCLHSSFIKKCAQKITKHIKMMCFTHGQCPTYQMTNKHMVREMLCSGEIPATFCAAMMTGHEMSFPWYKQHEFEYFY